eukprot:CAMPEP_0198210752 /NCGR_PEP_ID=MMETSP1445-20131203/22168_1 /TAXON_ID=36898 /ORGANISM="Pyramimonas sp., Strain CCMP2087" /LENGTH=244 /DNA_ID=CAMNT_0043884893 /DNA_START=355 /DNA_END=1089 /DNA_ORIENTATION=+
MAECRVQKLYQVCNRVFRGSKTPSAEGLCEVRAVIETLTAKDLGMDVPLEETQCGFGFFGLRNVFSNQFSHASRFSPPIKYLQVHECDNFTIAVFCLPTSAVIPLHDHPGMVVMSKLLYGSMYLRAYDWLGGAPEVAGTSGRARLVQDEVLTGPSQPMTLFPTSGGNIHSFTAITHCAVLDVLAPPYRPADGRDCLYYSETSPGEKCLGADALLAEMKAGDDFVVERGVYKGPTIVVNESSADR